jgi:hypothetical protein
MEILKLEFNELTYPELWETISALAKGEDRDEGLKQFTEFTLIVIAQKPKEVEPATFKAPEPETFGNPKQTFGGPAR